MQLIEINDKDEKREKTTYFVVRVEDSDLIKVEKAIRDTWEVPDYDVRTLRKRLITIKNIEFIYDCTNENKIVEMGL